MKCIFCGEDSSGSKSVEHIIPESFGNKTATLRKGIVCDKCNNYFARKVEKPFLESEVVRMLRQELELDNKDGKVITDYSYPPVNKEQVKQICDDFYLIYSKEDKTEKEVSESVAKYQDYIDSTDKILLTPSIIVSRLLAKIAIEYFVYRCGSSNDVCEYILTDEAFAEIRKHARYGTQKIWPYRVRRIYARNEAYKGDPFSSISWEADFLFLGNGEVYFIIAMHGIEYAINLLIPSSNGYEKWLNENQHQSPLYIDNKVLQNNFYQYAETMFTEEQKAELESYIKQKEKRQ